jgi:pyruvate,water dikinase
VRLGRAGLPIPDGFCLAAEAYRHQVAALGLEASARGAFASSHPAEAKQHALHMKLGLLEQPIDLAVLQPLLEAWRDLVDRTGALIVVRSSALVEDRFGSSFAGQFESYLGIDDEAEMLTAVRRAGRRSGRRAHCGTWRRTNWIRRTRPWRSSCNRSSALAPQAAGLSRTADGGMLINATLGLGSSIAQGEVTPDRFELDRDGTLRHVAPGRKDHAVSCGHRRAPSDRSCVRGTGRRAVPRHDTGLRDRRPPAAG